VTRHPVPLVDRRLRRALAAGVAAVVLVASVVDPPSTGTPTVLFGLGIDKWLHAVGYAGLAAAVGYARLDGTGLDGRALLAVFCLVTAYGFGVELVQAPLPARSFDLADAATNAVGAALGTAPYLRLRGR
jgi:VanZ family protein